jgi:alkylation response protein AidB-like acyl-CoA dehydrogenase
VRLFLPDMTAAGVGIDLSVWRAAGMRGTATVAVVFDQVFVPDDETVGDAGDYYRSPFFSGVAWRVLAVQLGGLEQVMRLHAERLAAGRGGDPVFRARFGRAVGCYEAARLLVAEAATRAEGGGEAAAIDAYVDLARSIFEDMVLICIDSARRNEGLATCSRPIRSTGPCAISRPICDSRSSMRRATMPRRG